MRTADRTSLTWSEMFGFASAIDPEVSGSRRRVAFAGACCVILVFALMCVNIAAFAMNSQAAAMDSMLKRLDRERMELETTLHTNTTGPWIQSQALALGMARVENDQRVQDDDEPR